MRRQAAITAAAGFQEGDEFRWLQHVAYRTRELQNVHPKHGFGVKEREYWENDTAFQRIRELMGKVLIAYDWGGEFCGVKAGCQTRC